MSKSKIFFYLSTSFIAGIFLSSFLEISNLTKLALVFICIVIACVFWRNPRVKVAGFCGLVLLLGIWHYEKAQAGSSEVAAYNDQDKITFQGVVVKEPDIRPDKIQLTVKVDKLLNGQITMDRKCRGRACLDPRTKTSFAPTNLGQVLATLPRHPQYSYGDKLELTGKLKTPKNFDDFSYQDYLARFNIYSICYHPEVKLISSGQGNSFLRILLAGKARLRETINSILPEPQASFLGGMLLGEKKAMSQEVKEWFNKCSTTHITVISGMHVSIIAGLLMNLALAIYLSRKQAFWFAVVGICLFVLITGAQTSAVRAGIMGGLVLLSMHSGRLSDIKNAILCAACVMLLANPYLLKFDVGFQLSFLATIGVIYLSPYLEKYIKFIPKAFKMRDSTSMTLSAQVMTLPLLLFHFGRISLISPVANILILPFIPLTMMLGFVLGILGLVWLFLGKIAGWAAWLFLTYEILVVRELSKIPFASVEIKNVWMGLLVVYYVLLFGWLWWRKRKEVVVLSKKV